MYKLFIILFLSFFNFSFLQAETIKKVEVSGNKRVNSETIKIYGEIQINKDYSEQDLNTILNNLYSTNFFEDVNIKLTNNILVVQVKEYPVINDLVILGETNKRYREKILERQAEYRRNNKEKIAKIYINVYSLKTSNKVPKGFHHRDEIDILRDSKIILESAKKLK